MKYFARLILFVAMALTLSQSACADNLLPTTELAGWSADSEALASLVQFVSESVDESHEGYILHEDRMRDDFLTIYGEQAQKSDHPALDFSDGETAAAA